MDSRQRKNDDDRQKLAGSCRPPTRPNGELRACTPKPLVNSGSQSNFSRSHEYQTHCSTCNRRPNYAAVPAPYLIRPGAQTHAQTYVAPFSDGPLPTRSRRSLFATADACTSSQGLISTVCFCQGPSTCRTRTSASSTDTRSHASSSSSRSRCRASRLSLSMWRSLSDIARGCQPLSPDAHHEARQHCRNRRWAF